MAIVINISSINPIMVPNHFHSHEMKDEIICQWFVTLFRLLLFNTNDSCNEKIQCIKVNNFSSPVLENAIIIARVLMFFYVSKEYESIRCLKKICLKVN